MGISAQKQREFAFLDLPVLFTRSVGWVVFFTPSAGAKAHRFQKRPRRKNVLPATGTPLAPSHAG